MLLNVTFSQTDSSLFHRVMIVPYEPQYYLSDADHEIVKETGKDPAIIRESFRKSVDLYVQRLISGYTPCLSLLNDADSMPQLKETLISIYNKAGYRYEAVMPMPVIKEYTDSVTRSLKKVNKETDDSRTATQYYIPPPDARFMNAVLSKPEVLQEIFAEFGTDIFVFLNQFEIKTNYKNCLDIANKIYQRELMVHFSVYDFTGKQLAGSYALAFFPSDSNKASEIVKTCFPEIAKIIASCIP